MSGKKEQLKNIIDASVARKFLMQNPDFLINNPDLYSILTPPDRSEGDRIVDFQNIMIEKIKKNLKDLQHNQGHLIDTSRNNLTTQAQVHEAVLCLLETEALNHIGHIVTQDWADMLHIDVIRICFEVDHPINPPALKEITLLQKGRVNEYLNQEDIILLRGEANVSEDIFGPAKPLVKTEALIKIPKTKYNPPGILAFGSRDLDMFYPGQGTELLRFLGKSYHKCMIQWLKQ
ncbi:MAG: DUF484 family protein [Kordiimonadaceae bacterium]|jgi:uncharacterized protein YigA (DUF484 family)|nr:DUF484 family protein [Kordiimonadaceae bacterium]MDA9619871.1 DUF484 family protein [Alphaproteobacteria bacterium]MDB4044230.1 DUF484 family protein [Emcibacteraceae bacterium]MBT6466484.1 DUF484 family protein [Kordiimonadaceae bacterium]MBT7544618.1 DUF484 family protein [Kordiimonadaceae bacterium]|tara:strand:+ start:17325 stop:18023 length:699 start_codon:yes stop_codon:yes gene_type:complete